MLKKRKKSHKFGVFEKVGDKWIRSWNSTRWWEHSHLEVGERREVSQYTRIHIHSPTFLHMYSILGRAPLCHVCAMAFNNRNQWAKLCWVSVTGPGKLHWLLGCLADKDTLVPFLSCKVSLMKPQWADHLGCLCWTLGGNDRAIILSSREEEARVTAST